MVNFQKTRASCGAAALSNASYLLRDSGVSEDVCLKSAGTTWEGTSVKGLVKGARKLGFIAEKLTLKEFPSDCTDVLIACVDHGAHWVVLQKMLSGRWLVIDGADNELVFTVSLARAIEKTREAGAKKPFTLVAIREPLNEAR